jgi:methanogenic corrinoid protein MtbC1
LSQPHLSRLFKSLADELIPNLIRVTTQNGSSGAVALPNPGSTLLSQCQHAIQSDPPPTADLIQVAQLCCQSSLELGSEEFSAVALNWVSEGLDIEVLYLDVIPMAVRHLHDLWAQDEITFYDVTRATWIVKQFIFRTSAEFVRPDLETLAPTAHRFQALVLIPPGCQHTLAALLVSQYLQRKGWMVLPGIEHEENQLLHWLEGHWVDLMCVSVSMTGDAHWLKTFIQRVKKTSKNPDIQCLIGGPLVALQPGLLEKVGAHAVCTHAREAHTLGLQLVRVHRKVRKLNTKTAFELSWLGTAVSPPSTPKNFHASSPPSGKSKDSSSKRGVKQRKSNENSLVKDHLAT